MSKPHTRTISIKGITWRYITLILILAIAGVMLITAIGFYTSRESILRHETIELELLSRDFGDMVGFYRNISHAVAKRQEVMDILEFGDVEQAVLWAKALRSIVPESIGVALIDQEGNVLGDPLQLKLGTQCISDLKAMLAGEKIALPPVHLESQTLRHFDLVVPVDSRNGFLGLLFMSFSLDILQQRVEQRVGAGHAMLIEDANGNPLAEYGTEHNEEAGHQVHLHAAIPSTDWHIHYFGEGWEGNQLFEMTIAVAAMIFTFSLIITLLLSTRLVRIFHTDLRRIRGLLDGIHSGALVKGRAGVTRLRETASIMADVSSLVGEIEQSNMRLKQQSMHDGLTGLLNRRAFDESLEHYVGLAARGVTSRLVMLDLDFFKQVNDRYGHAVGDEVLRALANTLLERCRSADVLARVGGDEFAVIMPGDATGDIGEWFNDVEKLFSQRQTEINGGKGIEPHCHLSAGSVVIEKGTQEDASVLMNRVDRRMYEAKRAGRASIQY